MTVGIPSGWLAEERRDLRAGEWRFYHAVDPDFEDSVSEQNVVLRSGERVTGPNGIYALLLDLEAWDSPPDDDQAIERLAEQIGHLVVEATSRSSGRVLLHPSRSVRLCVRQGELVLDATFSRDGAPWPITVAASRDGSIRVEYG